LAKVTKTAPSGKASLPHKAFALQIAQNLGCNRFSRVVYFFKVLKFATQFCPGYPVTSLPLVKKLLCPAAAQGHHSFALFRPKLTRWEKTRHPIIGKSGVFNGLTGHICRQKGSF